MAAMRKTQLILKLFCCYLLIGLSHSATETDTLLQGEELRDWQHLTSSNKLFKLKFFSPNTTKNRYLGIFYRTPQDGEHYQDEDKPVWVANRDLPIFDTSGSFLVDSHGRLKISHDGGDLIVLNPARDKANVVASVVLLNNGNLVLRALNTSSNQTLWQSFDYPSDTLLPGMKLGINFKTGHRWSLTSWTSDQVPASGSFTLGGDPDGTNQVIIWWHDSVWWTSGNWSTDQFNNTEKLSDSDIHFSYVSNQDEKYLTYSSSSQYMSRYTIASFGVINNENGPVGFGQCGRGMENDPGCRKEEVPSCRRKDIINGDLWFEQKQGFFYGDSFQYYENGSFSLFDCQQKCRNNCSCDAYASIFDNGTGCQIWTNFKFETNDNIPSREIFFLRRDQGKKWWLWLAIAVGFLVLPIVWCLCLAAKRRITKEARKDEMLLLCELQGVKENHRKGTKISNEVQLFSFQSIELASNNFSESNKLGEGGFGQVYKGTLLDGREVAIKRLSRSSEQGLQEFKNEILLIAKLQHTNLVRLLGCCIECQEKILVYDYMSNKSLNFFLFDRSKRELLNWSKRLSIIEGIAQGLLYLHKYSRFKVIHRDLKASNILLDDNMNPKISDFGMARMFATQEYEENTKRIVGTYGYMSPEYAMSGIVSFKTDVFSFGVLLLEIVSGKKNYCSYHFARPLNLIGLAWELWKEGKALELMDSTLWATSHDGEVVLKCIHIGLLCVQDQAIDRPLMVDVVSMLANENLQLPAPKKPAFFSDIVAIEVEKDERTEKCSNNDLSFTDMEPR